MHVSFNNIKRKASSWFLSSIFIISNALAQQYVVEVPGKMEVAGMKLHIRDGAKGPIQNYCDKLTINNKFFRQLVDRADAYMPIIERIFEEEGVPTDFKYLVIQESSLVSDQVSTSNAVGYWQFKKETGWEMGLRIDEDIDERMNIFASSRAAARYLKKNNMQLNNWIYALLAYYAGPKGVIPLIDPNKIGATEMDIDENTHWYVLKFLAYKLTFQDNLNRNTKPILLVMDYDNCENKTLRDIANETNFPLEELEFYNKWAKKGVIPGDKDYVVAIPVKPEQQQIFLAAYSNEPRLSPEALKPWKEKTFFGLFEKPVTNTANNESTASSANSGIPVFYAWNGIKAIMAEKGDNIDKIALRAGISKEQFLEYNDLRIFDPIKEGQVYYVKPKRRKAKVPYHTVKPNETLWEISQNYGIKLSHLLRKNRMKHPEKLKPGRVLWLRKRMPEDEPIQYEPVPETPVIKQSPPVIVNSSDKKPTDSNTDVVNRSTVSNNTVKNNPKQEEQTSADLKRVSEKVKQALDVGNQASTFDTGNDKQDQVAKVANYNSDRPKVIHKVEARQTIYGISRNYGVPVDSIIAWNNLTNTSLSMGQSLLIYTQNKPEERHALLSTQSVNNSSAKVSASSASPGAYINDGIIKSEPDAQSFKTAETKINTLDAVEIHEVQAGETLYRISKKYGIKVEDILSWNNKTEPVISVGEKLRVKPL